MMAPSNPGHRRRDQSAATRARLLSATRELVERRHLSAVTIRQVARHAGLSTGSLASHFGDKAGLLTAVCEEPLRGPVVRLRPGSLDDLPSALSHAVEASPGIARWLAHQLFIEASHDPSLDRARLSIGRSVAGDLAELVATSQAGRAYPGGLLQVGGDLLAQAYLRHGMAMQGQPPDLRARLDIIVEGLVFRREGG